MTAATIDMQALLQWIDKGDIKTLAHDHGISPRQANNIIQGRSCNYSFVERIVEKAESNMRLAQRTQILKNNLYLTK